MGSCGVVGRARAPGFVRCGLVAGGLGVFAQVVSLCRLNARWLHRDFLPLRGLLAVRRRERYEFAETYLGTCHIRRGCSGHEGGQLCRGTGV